MQAVGDLKNDMKECYLAELYCTKCTAFTPRGSVHSCTAGMQDQIQCLRNSNQELANAVTEMRDEGRKMTQITKDILDMRAKDDVRFTQLEKENALLKAQVITMQKQITDLEQSRINQQTTNSYLINEAKSQKIKQPETTNSNPSGFDQASQINQPISMNGVNRGEEQKSMLNQREQQFSKVSGHFESQPEQNKFDADKESKLPVTITFGQDLSTSNRTSRAQSFMQFKNDVESYQDVDAQFSPVYEFQEPSTEPKLPLQNQMMSDIQHKPISKQNNLLQFKTPHVLDPDDQEMEPEREDNPSIKRFIVDELKKINISKHFRGQISKLSEHIQSTLISYQAIYGSDFIDHYVFTHLMVGDMPREEAQLIQQALIEDLKDEDCIGSINYFRNRLDGFLLMPRVLLNELQSANQKEFKAQYSPVEEDFKIMEMIARKWKAVEVFLLFD